jgi:hypothetical protein
MLLIATTITLFISNVHLMAVEYLVTIVKRQPAAAECHTAVTSQRTRLNSSKEPQTSPVYLHSSTVYCNSLTVSDGTDRTQNNMHSAATFHITDRQ